MNSKHGQLPRSGTKREEEESQSGPGQLASTHRGPCGAKRKAKQLNPIKRPIKISFVTSLLSLSPF
jgi:hypothetical protein